MDSFWYEGNNWRTYPIPGSAAEPPGGDITAIVRKPNPGNPLFDVFWTTSAGSIRWARLLVDAPEPWTVINLETSNSVTPYGGIRAISRFPDHMELL